MLRVIMLGVLALLLLAACSETAPSGAKQRAVTSQDPSVVTVYKSPT